MVSLFATSCLSASAHWTRGVGRAASTQGWEDGWEEQQEVDEPSAPQYASQHAYADYARTRELLAAAKERLRDDSEWRRAKERQVRSLKDHLRAVAGAYEDVEAIAEKERTLLEAASGKFAEAARNETAEARVLATRGVGRGTENTFAAEKAAKALSEGLKEMRLKLHTVEDRAASDESELRVAARDMANVRAELTEAEGRARSQASHTRAAFDSLEVEAAQKALESTRAELANSTALAAARGEAAMTSSIALSAKDAELRAKARQLDTARRELAAAKADAGKEHSTNEEVREAEVEEKSEVTHLRSELDAVHQEYESESQRAKVTQQDLKRMTDSLQAQTRMRAELKASAAQEGSEVAVLRKQLEEASEKLNSTLQEQRHDLTDLRAETEEARNQSAALQALRASQAVVTEHLRAEEAAALAAKDQELNSTQSTFEIEASALRSEVQRQLDQSRRADQRSVVERESLSRELASAEAIDAHENATIRGEAERLESDYVQLRAQKLELEVGQRALRHTKMELNETRVHLATSEREADAANSLREELRLARDALASARANSSRLETVRRKLVEKDEQLNASRATLFYKLNDTRSKLDSSARSVQQLESALTNAKGELSVAENSSKALRAQVHEREAVLRATRQDLAKTRVAAEISGDTIKNLSRVNAELEAIHTKFQAQSKELNATRSEVESMKSLQATSMNVAEVQAAKFKEANTKVAVQVEQLASLRSELKSQSQAAIVLQNKLSTVTATDFKDARNLRNLLRASERARSNAEDIAKKEADDLNDLHARLTKAVGMASSALSQKDAEAAAAMAAKDKQVSELNATLSDVLEKSRQRELVLDDAHSGLLQQQAELASKDKDLQQALTSLSGKDQKINEAATLLRAARGRLQVDDARVVEAEKRASLASDSVERARAAAKETDREMHEANTRADEKVQLAAMRAEKLKEATAAFASNKQNLDGMRSQLAAYETAAANAQQRAASDDAKLKHLEDATRADRDSVQKAALAQAEQLKASRADADALRSKLAASEASAAGLRKELAAASAEDEDDSAEEASTEKLSASYKNAESELAASQAHEKDLEAQNAKLKVQVAALRASPPRRLHHGRRSMMLNAQSADVQAPFA